MGRKYNMTYKVGRCKHSNKAMIADRSKLSKITWDINKWSRDTRKWDYPGVDTPNSWNARNGFPQTTPFKYRSRSHLVPSRPGSENIRHRRYYFTTRRRRRY